MKQGQKRTRWSSTNKIIRKILLDYYMSSSAQPEWQKFIDRSLWIYDSHLTQQFNDWFNWKLQPWTKLNLNWATKEQFHKALDWLFDPEHPIEWNVDVSTLFKLGHMFQSPIFVKDIKEKYWLSYDTINKRVKPFFNSKTIQNWQIRSNVFYPKPEVYAALTYYLAINKELDKQWDYFRKIYKLFEE